MSDFSVSKQFFHGHGSCEKKDWNEPGAPNCREDLGGINQQLFNMEDTIEVSDHDTIGGVLP